MENYKSKLSKRYADIVNTGSARNRAGGWSIKLIVCCRLGFKLDGRGNVEWEEMGIWDSKFRI